MEFQTLQDATYFIIHETEGFKQNVYYDGKGIPTFGLGVAFIGYNSKNNSFSAISRIGNTPISNFIRTITSSEADAIEFENALRVDLVALQQGQKPSSTYPSINMSEERFKSVIWNGDINLHGYYLNSVIDNVGKNVWNKLSLSEQTALFSLNYNSSELIGKNLKSALSFYVNGSSDENKMLGKLSAWYEILYASNGGGDRKGVQNRRFMEADAFLGDIHNKIEEGKGENNSIIRVNNFAEANATIAFMNKFSEQMISYMGNISEYKKRNYEIVQNNFSEAVSVFLSNQNYKGNASIDTLFTEWNLYTDLQINTSTGTTSYGNITGSDKRDLIFITGEQDGTTVHADAGNDFVSGSSKKDIIYSGSGDDVIYTYGGNDEVYTTDGKKEDYNEVYLGAGSDTFHGGDGDDFVDGGSGRIDLSHVSSNIGAEDATTDVNNIDLGGGQNRYIGGKGTDKVQGSGYNTVYLGAGSDEYIGGDGVDIVDGGSATSSYGADGLLDTNKIHLGGGDDRYIGGIGKDIVYGGNGDDFINGGDGENELYGGVGEDHLYGGQHQDKLYGGTGRDYFYPEKGTNRIDCGTDNNTDVVMINNDAGGVDTIYNVSARDIISCSGGFNLESMEQVGSDVIIYGNRNNKIVIKDVKLPDEEEPEIPAENMPILYQPDGSVLQWDGSEYVDSGTKFPPYDEKPEDPEDLPDIPTPEPSEGDNPPQLPVIPEKPEEPEGGTEKPQTDNPPSIPEDTKGDIGKLWEDAENSRSPLVVDLDGDGKIETVSTDGNVHFDFDSNQKIENSGWIGKNEGFLVRDINGNGQIDNGTEMFGNHTVLQNGKNAVNGFEALKDLDSNGNGKFDAEDDAWSQVKVWRDANTNGIVDSGELLTLEQAGIESINLKYDYQKEADENGNLEIQQGTFNRTDGTTGKVSDVWFDVDGTNTILNEDDITIPDDIKNLPDIKGWGNVYSLHAAMALDETGTLKSLVEQYLAATDDNTKDTLLNDIIYHWAGVQDMDPVGRNPSQVYGNVLGDARKLEALEEFMGEDYLGTWCWGERESNPHGQAAPMILQAFELLKNYVGTILSADMANNPYLQKIILTYNAETKHWDVNVDQAVALLQEAFEADATNGKIEMLQLSNILRFYDNAEDVIAAFQAKGSADGTFFETELLNFGHNSVGSAANDNLFGTEGNDLMDGLAGNDIIKAAEGDDTALGGSGNDYIYGEDGDDVLDGEEGNDYLFGGNGNDTLKGGAGDDVLSGGNGADIYLFEKGFGNDSIDNTQDDTAPNADIIKFGEGILPENAILQRQGFDLIISVSYEDGTTDSVRIFSYFDKQGTSSTTVSAIQFADGTSWDYEYVLDHWNSLPDINGGVTLEGNNDDNRIDGTAANDILGGNGGDDTIYGNAGNDFIYGGKGNDRLEGGAGNDTYLWHLGDGLDTIYDNANQDTIQFGEGIVWDYLTFRNSGNDLIILVHEQEDQGIIIQNFFSGQDYKIEKINFFDGSSVNLSEIGLTLKQLKTGESIKGTEFDDIIYANGGNDTVNAGIGDDTIYGEAGFDTLYGEDGNDVLIGGTGNDRLEGGLGDDTYIYNVGDGLDTIYDDNRGNADNDTIKFGEGISFSDITFSRKDNNLIMTLFNDITQGVIIQNFFSSSYYQVEKLEFADGTTVPLTERGFEFVQNDGADNVSGTDYDDTIYGKGGNDTIYGYSGNDTLIGGKGNDRLEGSYGDDTYIWNLGDGFDTIYDYNGGNTDNDTIKFGEGISLEDLSFERDGNSLIIYVNNDRTQGIKIQDYYSSTSYYKVEKLEFADGSAVDTSTIAVTIDRSDALAAQNITGTDNNDTLTGGNFDDTIEGNYGDDIIDGGAGNDTLRGNSGNDTLIGGKGNDRLEGSYGDDTYIWNLGDGFDTIYDYNGGNTDNDTIKFGEGISFEDLSFERDGNSLIIYVNNDKTQGIKIQDYYSSYSQVEKLKFADESVVETSTIAVTTDRSDALAAQDITGTDNNDTLTGGNFGDTLTGNDGNDVIDGGAGNDTLKGNSGNDTLIGGKGNDRLEGSYGDDTYIWNLGDGFDTIYDYNGGNTDNDTIKFGEGISFEDLSFERDGNSLIIYVNNDKTQGIKIQDYYSSYSQVEKLKFADESVVETSTIAVTTDRSDALAAQDITGTDNNDTLTGGNFGDTLTGNDGNDVIDGGAGNDTLKGNSGNDTLIGGKGNDRLEGSYGDDTYIWNLGDGFDTIYDYNGGNTDNDTIKFGEGISFEDLLFERDGNDLVIYVNNDKTQGITIQNYYSGYSQVEKLEFADGTIVETSSVSIVEPEEPSENAGQTISGTSDDDILIGSDGDDTINAEDGYNDITGGKGNDIISAGYDRDTFYYNLGDGYDKITDLGGRDQIIFGDGISKENISFYRKNDNLIISINDDFSQGIEIIDFFRNNDNRIENIKFADNSTLRLTTGLILKTNELDGSITGTVEDDTLIGNIGENNLNGSSGDDILNGGKGNDTLDGDVGNDTYIWNLGDDIDTIRDTAGLNTIKFGENISFDDLTFKQDGNNLRLIVKNDISQGIIIQDYFSSNNINNNYHPITIFEFSDGSKFDFRENNITLTYDNRAETITGNIGDNIIDAQGGDDTITTYGGDDIINGGAGDDEISSGNGNDIITGGSGNDIINGEAGNDTYIWNLGDGMDTITDSSGFDKIKFGEGITSANLSFFKQGNNLLIFINDNHQEGIIINRYFEGSYNIELLEFTDGSSINLSQSLDIKLGDTGESIDGTIYNDTITGGDGNDTINGGNGDDTLSGGIGEDTMSGGDGADIISGGTGDDTIDGGAGNDTYIWNLGDGMDTITDSQGTDKIVFGEGISYDDLSFSQTNSDLYINVQNMPNQGLLIKNYFASGNSNRIETLEFSNGNLFDLSKNALILKGDGTVNGTIYDDSITGNNNDDTITAGDGNDIIYGNAGNDNIDGGNGDDIIYGGQGCDTLKGGYGNDTYVWNLGDDLDTIEDDAGQNTLLFGNGISFNDLDFNMLGNNLLITVNGDKNQGVQINNFLNENDLYKIEYLKFSDGTSIYLPDLGLNMAYGATDDTINGTYNDDTIIAGNGNDTVNAGDGNDSIYGGKGNDALNGGNGRDSYYYNLGDGYDTITETRGNDKIIFGEGISINNLSFRQDGSNLDILINNDVSQGVTVKDFYSGTNYQVETLQFANGSTFNLSTQGITLQQTDADDTVKGTSYNDIIYGNSGHDTINAGDGNDTIVGGIGNDILNGGNGDDTYVYNLGDGFDTITDTGGDDKIVFGEGISQSDLSFEQIGNDLKISVNGKDDKGIQINDHFRYDDSKVETIEFHDGSTLDISNADQLIQAMSSFNISNSASTDALSNPTENVSDMYSLAASQDLTRKAI